MRDINDPIYINDLAKIMEATGLMRVKIANRNSEIVLDKSSFNPYGAQEGVFGYSPHLGGAQVSAGQPVVSEFAETEIATQPPVSAPANAPTSTPTIVAAGEDVTSPIVGVFYNSPSPDAAPFVAIGDVIKKGDVLCIVEAMKLMNEVVAEKDGKILDICVKNGDVVEFGTVMFKVGQA